MPVEKDEDALLLTETIGLSQTLTDTEQQCVLYGGDEDGAEGRGDSLVTKGDAVVLSDEGLGQGGAQANVKLGELRADKRVLCIGAQTTLRIKVTNEGKSEVDYTLDFKRGGSVFTSVTKTVSASSSVQYSVTVDRSTAGTDVFQAGTSNELTVAWTNVTVDNFVADPGTVYLKSGQDTSTLTLTLSNCTGSSVSADVSFVEDPGGSGTGGTVLNTQSVSLSGGGQQTVTYDVTRTSPQEHDYVARITDNSTGVKGDSVAQTVIWTNQELILGPLRADDKALYKGDSTTLRIEGVNVSGSDQSFTVDFVQVPSGTVVGSDTVTIPDRASGEFTASVSKSSVGCREFRANTSNRVKVCWSNLRPGALTASPSQVIIDEGEDTTTLSITVDNPSSMDIQTDVVFTEDGTPIYDETVTIGAGGSYTFDTDVTKTVTGFFDYQAEITDNSVPLTMQTNVEQVSWTTDEEGLGQLPPDTPDFSFYDYADDYSDGFDPNTGTSGDRFRLVTATATTTKIGVEDIQDLGDRDFDDIFMTYDFANWDDFGYMSINAFHGTSGHDHSLQIGAYDDGRHGDQNNRTIFDLIAYDDGDLYDSSTGDFVASWR